MIGTSKFFQKEKDLPQPLLKMQKYGLETKWCNDIRSYKKLILTLKLFPNAIIIMADDVYYRCCRGKKLYDEYSKHLNIVEHK